MRNNVLNFVFFLFIAAGFYFLWSHAEKNWFPQRPDPAAEAKKKAEEEEQKRDAEKKLRDEKRAAAGAVAGLPAIQFDPVRPVKPTEPPKPPEKIKPRERGTLLALGDDSFYTKILLNTEGGGVQQVVLTKFDESDRLGREMKGVPLSLVPGVPRVREKYLADNYPVPDLHPGKIPPGTATADPAYTIFHYANPDDKYPDPSLGVGNWECPEGYRDAAGTPQSKVRTDGVHEMVFERKLDAPHFVKFRKTYTLAPREYHIGLKLEIERLPGGEKGKGQLRYQISGPRGLPIEGEWYNNTYRVALIGWTDKKGRPGRQYETAVDVNIKRGGDAVPRGEYTFKYMAITTQYFASGVAVDDSLEGAAKNPWSYVRATSELPPDKEPNPNAPFFDDMTVRAASEPLDLAAGEKVTHAYVIYNGPAKVRLLGLMEGDRAVDEALVTRYQDNLGLKTLTDYQSPTWLGSFANAIYWTDLVIAFTNLMHWFLSTIHGLIPSWGLSIIVLTIIVRLILLYPSKKQTKMNMRMMEVTKKLAPQFEELKKKYPDDFHSYNRAKMQLMMAHGVNPLAQMGGCLLLFAQMPIMMGLYFCLQESVFFRLEPFLWVSNLAAPDMTLWWGENIPFISVPDALGGILYLGPYLNILPVLAIVLMFWQQLKMLPPATDDQSRQQRMMMKMMMFLMPIFFYKFAAGLAMYFIIGTLWGLAERRIIKKADDATAAAAADGTAPLAPPPDAPPKPKGWLGRKIEEMKERMDEMKRRADEQSKRQVRNDKNAPNPAPGSNGSNPPPRDDRRDKKKKRRK